MDTSKWTTHEDLTCATVDYVRCYVTFSKRWDVPVPCFATELIWFARECPDPSEACRLADRWLSATKGHLPERVWATVSTMQTMLDGACYAFDREAI